MALVRMLVNRCVGFEGIPGLCSFREREITTGKGLLKIGREKKQMKQGWLIDKGRWEVDESRLLRG